MASIAWNGFHHHAALTFLAYGFLAQECQRAAAADPTAPPGGARHGA